MKEKTRIEETAVELTSSFDREERPGPDPASPFRILVLGDFSGRESRSIRNGEDIGLDRFPVRVDRDNLDALPGALGVETRIQLIEGGPILDVRIRSLEDFHPDLLFRNMAGFRYLKQTRLELQDPETFEHAAGEIRSWDAMVLPGASGAASGDEPASETQRTHPPPSATDSEELVRELLERSEAEAAAGDTGRADFDRFVASVVKPHLVAADPPDRDALVRRMDETIGSWMRSVLHHPHFQSLEAAWRALAFLVDRVDSNDAIEIHLMDVSRDELADDLRSAGGLAESRIYRLLTDPASAADGRGRWSLFAGVYTFGPGVDDVAMLGRLAKVASAAGAPFLAAASPALVDPESFVDSAAPTAPAEESTERALWEALRDLPEAVWIALALPRFLLRLPYGTATDPLEGFAFEEVEVEGEVGAGGGPRHEDFLWGNPALACACLIAQARASGGRPGDVRDVEGLPVYISASRDNGEKTATPCAEVTLSDRAARAIMDQGFIPLLSMAGRDVVRVARFQSIASLSRPIAGL